MSVKDSNCIHKKLSYVLTKIMMVSVAYSFSWCYYVNCQMVVVSYASEHLLRRLTSWIYKLVKQLERKIDLWINFNFIYILLTKDNHMILTNFNGNGNCNPFLDPKDRRKVYQWKIIKIVMSMIKKIGSYTKTLYWFDPI